MDMSAISGIITSLDAAKNIAKASMDMSSTIAIQTQLADLSAKLFDARRSALALQEEYAATLNRIAALEQECMQLRERNREKEKYDLKDVYLGSFALVRKPVDGEPYDPHWLCQPCFEKGQNFVLQGRLQGRMKIWTCPNCKSEFQTNPQVSPANPFVSRTHP